ncbi:beta-ketoacyl synthase N-terminal-like domain-containing protein [Actinokineospora enzanensis]|uniref:beta-ketoacyl synthase N-terminal-like domain-containing protein n=1 Tax=Actinokineospora enzanensis TaxID=155975 RepID=UPI00038073DF|nr:beta-ketoacyl synthase N-terminal-like domain-containing protein [Actinokineospora enzanensis]
MSARVSVTGCSVYVPDLGAPGPEKAKQVLGRKGLLYKEPATRLALCAVHRALGGEDGVWVEPGEVDPHTAVVAASNLGSVSSIVDTVRTARAEGWRSVSPLAAPNASANVIASTVAIWYRFGGPNLLFCSGALAGMDAIAAGGLLIRSGRARRVVVVGAEPEDPVAREVHAGRSGKPRQLRQGAGCLLLEPAGAPGALADLGLVRSVEGLSEPDEFYGADSVIRVAMAVSEPDADRVEIVGGDDADGRRSITVFRAGGR